ncbi:nucleotidyltransferase family protein [Rhodoferax antarcticus]|nr:nucleotidyltransferase family protein [Rhodoferax antarcticus]
MPVTPFKSIHPAAQPSPVPAMLLAAGRGERMRPLTDTCPKPLLPVQGKPLMQWHLEALQRGGCQQVVINTAWLEDLIVQTFNGLFGIQPLWNKREQLSNSYKMTLQYSTEGRDFGAALETAGGICRALPLLFPPTDGVGRGVFWVLAADVFTPGFVFSSDAVERFAASGKLAHLWLVPNPAHNPRGDFGLDAATGLALNLPKDDPQPRYTYSTIGLYHRALFAPPWCDVVPGNSQGVKAALAPLLRAAMDQGQVSAELYAGAWTDVGTPERLAQLNA